MPSGFPRTLGALRASGHELRGVKDEIRSNLLTALSEGRDPWPGIVGFESTVLPQLERALIAGHDVVLLGERGQGKTRLLRTLATLLDEWTPVIEGSELGEHPYDPITPASRRRAAELGDDLPVAWRHRDERYTEKLATPDTAVADLIGDVDPVKVAEGRSLGDPETIHYGLVPRAHRGIVTINELPDLAERIQVALLNVMEERDIQVRGYTLRLPLDVLLVASANPEDYTNRGRIITPLKDRFGAEVRTHYPLELSDEIALVRQEAGLVAEVPRHLLEVVARFTRSLRESSAVDQGSGVSARFAVAAAETVAAAALRRAAITGEERPVARPVDLESVPSVLRGKLEFASGEEGREMEHLEHLLRRATADTARARLRGIDLNPLAEAVAEAPVRTGERVPAVEVVAALPAVEELTEVAKRLDAGGTENPGPMASAAELALELLYLTRRLTKSESDDDKVVYGRVVHEWEGRTMARRSRRYAYGPYVDGPDPLASPVDIRAALDEIGRDVMEGSSPRNALQELLRRGTRDRRGLDELTREVWQRRSRLQRENRLDGTLQQVRELLQRALDAERDQLGRQDTDDARFREMQLDALPSDTGGAVRELNEYDWQSAGGREAYEEIRDLLGREMLDQRFQGMKQAMENATPEDVERIREMLDDLNSLLANHAAGQDTTEQFRQFMQEHGEFFPENPQNTEELVDLLAQRAAAAQRMLNSMSAEQRAELMELSQQAFGDPRLAQALAQLDAQLQGLRPGEDWEGRGRFRGDNPLGMGEATRAMEQLGQLDALAEQLSQSYPGARMEDIDLDALGDHLGDQARVDARALAELQRELERQGLFERAPDGSLQLSPKALRRLGESALRDIVDKIGARRGEREDRRSGPAGEATGATRPWAFGDTEAWSVPRTLLNAQLRRAGGDDRVLDVTDVEIVETEQRSRAAVALLVDTSWSMVQDGRWVPMKRTALALHQLISTRFRGDDLKLITFGRHARSVELGELVGLEGVWEQGTNLHHALLLAGEHLRHNPDAQPVVLVVTDGEPTAHLEPDGEAVFDWPPSAETLQATIGALDKITTLRPSITFFMLGDDPRLALFVDDVARRCSGRVVAPTVDGLGAEVVSDYIRARKR